MDNQQPQQRQDTSIWSALGLAWELGYIIAIPAALLGFGGAYLDKYLDKSPLFLLLGFVLALSISTIGIIRRVKQLR